MTTSVPESRKPRSVVATPNQTETRVRRDEDTVHAKHRGVTMRVATVQSEDASGEFEPAIFRVRLWNRPLLDGGTWALDEFELIETRDVFEVIAWAEAQRAASFEVAVRWPDSHVDARGSRVERFRYMRVAGQPGEESTTTRVETFLSTD